LQFKPTDFFIAHILNTPPDLSDDFEEIDIRTDSEEEDLHYEEEDGLAPMQFAAVAAEGQLEEIFPADLVHRALRMSHGDVNAALNLLVNHGVGDGGPEEVLEID
jgi:hypothetical protein